jgi:S-adenosylmethionine decarboxylase
VRLEAGRKDSFIDVEGAEAAGVHLLADFWGATGVDDLGRMEGALVEAVAASGATLLHTHLHHFTPNDGISGVALLAESHISVHTWPERSFAAFDIFMCGATSPERALAVLERAFSPRKVVMKRLVRGRAGDEG